MTDEVRRKWIKELKKIDKSLETASSDRYSLHYYDVTDPESTDEMVRFLLTVRNEMYRLRDTVRAKIEKLEG